MKQLAGSLSFLFWYFIELFLLCECAFSLPTANMSREGEEDVLLSKEESCGIVEVRT
jgi:hypothetical protein